jgi:hypothetical protein
VLTRKFDLNIRTCCCFDSIPAAREPTALDAKPYSGGTTDPVVPLTEALASFLLSPSATAARCIPAPGSSAEPFRREGSITIRGFGLHNKIQKGVGNHSHTTCVGYHSHPKLLDSCKEKHHNTSLISTLINPFLLHQIGFQACSIDCSNNLYSPLPP